MTPKKSKTEDSNHLAVTVRIAPGDYERLKQAFEQGQLAQFGIKYVYLGSAEQRFANAEKRKRATRESDDTPHDR